MNPISWQSTIDKSITSVIAIRHVFIVGNVPIMSRYYEQVGTDTVVALQRCHDEALVALEHVLNEHGLMLTDDSDV